MAADCNDHPIDECMEAIEDSEYSLSRLESGSGTIDIRLGTLALNDIDDNGIQTCTSMSSDNITDSRAFYIPSKGNHTSISKTQCSSGSREESMEDQQRLISLSHEDYSDIDDCLRQYIENILLCKDKLRLVMQCDVVQFLYPTVIPALLAVSTESVYVIKVRGQLSMATLQSSLQLVHECPLSALTRVEIGLGGQSFRLEAGAKEPAFKVLVGDETRCKRFLKPFTVLLMDVSFHASGGLQRISHDLVTSQLIQRDLLTSHPHDGVTETVKVHREVKLYVLGHQVIGRPLNGNGEFVPVTIVITPSHIIMATENHHLQRRHPDVGQNASYIPIDVVQTCSFELRDIQNIKDIKYMESGSYSDRDVSVTYCKCQGAEEYTWRLTMASEHTRDTFVSMATQTCREAGGLI